MLTIRVIWYYKMLQSLDCGMLIWIEIDLSKSFTSMLVVFNDLISALTSVIDSS